MTFAPAFVARKWLQGESYLQEFSDSIASLNSDLSRKSVSIVGNARSLSKGTYGEAIDDGELVIRMHAAPLPAVKSHGTRTDWLALAMPVDEQIINDRNPSRLLWMAKKRKRVRRRFVDRKGFYLHPVPEWNRMHDELGAPPTTGVMLIDLVARSEARAINLYGFDFFASLSLSGRRTAKQVPHDFAAEKTFVEKLLSCDERVVLNSIESS